jgi:hypothetical protein
VNDASLSLVVIPAKAGIQGHMFGILPLALDPRFRGDDENKQIVYQVPK